MQRVATMIGLLVLASAPTLAQDPVKVAAKQCKVAFENDYVRVLSWSTGPHEKTAMHDHPAMVSISLSGGKTRFTSPDGKSREVETKAGQASWSDPDKHSSEELGGKASGIIQVELKKRPGAGMVALAAAEDSVAVDPKHYKVEFQNDRVRVLRIKYGPGEKSVMHGHPANVAVFLTPGQAKMTSLDGKTAALDMKAGQVQWADKEKHLPQNSGSKPFELILLELK
jgi:quercetin dioxygenase-like cupin family protein